MLRDPPPGLEEPRKKRRRKRDKWILRTTEHGDKTISDVLSEHLKTTLDERMRDYTKVFIKITAEERERGACEFCRFQGILQRVHTNRLPMRDIIQQVIDSHKDTLIASDNWGHVVETLFKECKHIQDTEGHIVVACHKCNPYLEDVEKDMVEFFRQHPHSWKDYIEWVEKQKKEQQEAQPQRQISDFFDAVVTSSSPCDTESQTSSDSDSTTPDMATSVMPNATNEMPDTTLMHHIYNNNEEILNIRVENIIPSDIGLWTSDMYPIVPTGIHYDGPLDTEWTYGPIPRNVDWRALLVLHDMFKHAGFKHGEYTSLGTIVHSIYDSLVTHKTHLLTDIHLWVLPHVNICTKETLKNIIRNMKSDAEIRIRRKHVSQLLKLFVINVCKGEFQRKRTQTRYYIQSQTKPKNHSHYMYRLCFNSSI